MKNVKKESNEVALQPAYASRPQGPRTWKKKGKSTRNKLFCNKVGHKKHECWSKLTTQRESRTSKRLRRRIKILTDGSCIVEQVAINARTMTNIRN